jgi:hypothetical protein
MEYLFEFHELNIPVEKYFDIVPVIVLSFA